MNEDRTKPTSAQLEYCRVLMSELGYDEENLTPGKSLEEMTRSQVSRIIDELRDELQG